MKSKDKNSAFDFWNLLSDIQKQKIEKSIRQLKNGEGISHEEVISEFRKKLKC